MRQVIPTDRLPDVVHFLQLKTAGDDHPAARDAVACLLGLSALRRSEITQLKVTELNGSTESIHVRTLKGGAPRDVPLDTFTWTALARLALRSTRKRSLTIFITQEGKPLDGRNLLRTWHRWSLILLGRPYRFHDLRHTAAQIVYNDSGHDIIAVQQLLGHRNVSTTQEYLASMKDIRQLLPTNQGIDSAAIQPVANGPRAE